MRIVHPRSPALRTATLTATLAALFTPGCFKNDSGTGSDGASESSGASGVATENSGAPTTGAPDSSSGDDPTATTTSAAASTGGDTGNDTGAAVDCDAYCDLIMQNCSGDFSQYGSADTCKTSCAAFAPGSPGDMSGNSLACRYYHAGAAAMANDVHCVHAGPGGAMACGSNCEGFCAIADKYCPDAWADNAACIVACETFPKDEPYDAKDVSGDTFACRLYHVTAASLDPTTHCAHIKGDSPTCQ